MRVLVTNDDGIEAPGLRALATAVLGAGHDVLVVAPVREMSGSASAMGPLASPDRLEFEQRAIAGLDVDAYAVDGPPAMCVIAGLLGGFGDPPDVVVSGINPGHNTGRSILHSGTVGAALTAAAWGSCGLAVSIGTGPEVHWSTAGTLAARALCWVAEAGVGTALNLNVPNTPVDALVGIGWAEPAPFGAVRTELLGRNARHLDLDMVDVAHAAPAGTDTAVVAAGSVAVTLLQGPTPSSRHGAFDAEALASWLW